MRVKVRSQSRMDGLPIGRSPGVGPRCDPLFSDGLEGFSRRRRLTGPVTPPLDNGIGSIPNETLRLDRLGSGLRQADLGIDPDREQLLPSGCAIFQPPV